MFKRKTAPRFIDESLSVLGLPADELAKLSGIGTVVDVDKGTILCRQGRTRTQLVWVLQGSAAVSRNGERIATLQPGDPAGEISLTGHCVHNTADVVMLEPGKVVALSTGDWAAVSASCPGLAEKVRLIAERRVAELS